MRPAASYRHSDLYLWQLDLNLDTQKDRVTQLWMNTAKFAVIAMNFLSGLFDYWVKYQYAKLLGVNQELTIMRSVPGLTSMMWTK